MDFTNDMVKEYAKKILGFAYSKTQDPYLAEDLSQEILSSLIDSLKRHEEIENLDAFVYTVASYTWSKYLRKNKRHWQNLNLDMLGPQKDSSNIEEDLIQSDLSKRLRAEIAHLNSLHRQITLLFYFENMTGDRIAKELDLPPSTIRWHLVEIRKKLKVGIEMENNLSFKPKRLFAGHDGYAYDEDMKGMGRNPLVDNICIACHGIALTVEEISRTLQVAAAYIEPLIEDLLYMDYLKLVNKNKYQCNFFITNYEFELKQSNYKLRNVGPYANELIKAFRRYIDDIIKIGFVGSDLEPDFLIWAIMPLTLNKLYYKALNKVLEDNKVTINTPKRKDGSQHWVCASFREKPNLANYTKEEIDFKEKSNGNGIKNFASPSGEKSLQYDGYATIKAGLAWREFGSDSMLQAIRRIADIIKNEKEINDYDKAMIANLVKDGYARVDEGKVKLLIPFFDEEEYKALISILNIIEEEVGEYLFAPFIEGFARAIAKEIPSFVSKDERTYFTYQAYPQYSVLYWLSDKGLLRYPSHEEAIRLSTLVWAE